MSILLKAHQVCKKYRFHHSQLALKSVSLTLEKGKIYVIKGKSGSGKSTLLNVLGGMERPTTGQVYFKERSFYELEDKEQAQIRNKNFSFIFQFFNLIPEMTVQENIELPKFFRQKNAVLPLDASDLAAEMGIKSLLNRKPAELSGGEQQRVAIARALVTCPDIIFADEPTGNLDEENTEVVLQLLLEQVTCRQLTLVVVTHEMKFFTPPHIKWQLRNGELWNAYD